MQKQGASLLILTIKLTELTMMDLSRSIGRHTLETSVMEVAGAQ